VRIPKPLGQALLGVLLIVPAAALVAVGCSTSAHDFDTIDAGDDAEIPTDASFAETTCDLKCRQKKCADGKYSTTLTGVVRDPAGVNPIYNAVVYVPLDPVEPFAPGVHCEACGAIASVKPVVSTLTNERGEFRLENVPVGANVPVVVQIGRWRRQLTVANVPECTDTALDPEATRLPRKKAEGDIPQMAVTTGCDPMECLLRQFGIDDSELTAPIQFGRVHLY
jgi:hypothetical protein